MFTHANVEANEQELSQFGLAANEEPTSTTLKTLISLNENQQKKMKAIKNKTYLYPAAFLSLLATASLLYCGKKINTVVKLSSQSYELTKQSTILDSHVLNDYQMFQTVFFQMKGQEVINGTNYTSGIDCFAIEAQYLKATNVYDSFMTTLSICENEIECRFLISDLCTHEAIKKADGLSTLSFTYSTAPCFTLFNEICLIAHPRASSTISLANEIIRLKTFETRIYPWPRTYRTNFALSF